MKQKLINFVKSPSKIMIALIIVTTIAFSASYYTLIVRTYLDVEGKASVKDSLTVYGTSEFNGVATFTAQPVMSTETIVVDSFTTTSATDSVTLSSSTGFTTSSKVLVSQWNPAWSTAVDTAIYSGKVVVTGANLTKLVVTRAKSYTGNGATAVKSAAQYFAKVIK